MTKQVQRRRGTAAQHSSFTGAEGEISVNTTNKSVHVHDGLTAGGIEAARADLANVSDADLNTALSGNTLASLTITSADINGGTIDGTVIGGSTPAAISGTTGTFSGNLTVDTNTLFVDAANNRVGVGTTSPSTTLDLVGGWVSNTGQLSIDTPSGETYSGLAILNNGTPKAFLYHDNSLGTLDLQTYTTDAIRFKTLNTERMRIDASGNVGIGVTSNRNSTKLDVLGDVTFGANASYYGTLAYNAGAGFLDMTSGDGGFRWFAQSGPTERMRITSGGSVQLGSSTGISPTLFVYDNDTTDAAIVVRQDGSAPVQIWQGAGAGELARITSAGNVGIGTSSPGQKLDVSGAVKATGQFLAGSTGAATPDYSFAADNTLGMFRAPGVLGFATGGTERMRIDSSGNVGIGTSSPTGNLDLANSGLAVAVIRSTGTADAVLRIQNSDTGTGSNGIYLGRSSAINYLWTYENEPWVFGTNNTERMRIASSGVVGIGTSSPVANTPLTLQGASGYTDTLWLKSAGTNIDSRINIAPTGTGLAQVNNTNGTPLAFQISGSEKVRIDSSGNVAINSNGSTSALDGISGAQIGNSSAATAGLALETSNRGYLWYIPSGSSSLNLWDSTANSDRLTIDSSGRVGIGTSSPATGGIHIAGDYASNKSDITLQNTNGGRTYRIGDGVGGHVGKLTFFDGTASAARMVIDSSGNVGVGTSSPAYKLSITGTTNTGIASFEGNNNGNLPGTDGDATLVIGTNWASGSAEVDYFHNKSAFKDTIGGHRFIQRTGASTASELMWLRENLLTFSTAAAERMRVNSHGHVRIGTTAFTTANDSRLVISGTNAGNWNNRTLTLENTLNNGPGIGFHDAAAGTAAIMKFWGPAYQFELRNADDSAFVPVLASAFVVSSDYRIKTDIVEVSSALEGVMALRPVSYVKDGAKNREHGLIAHEVQAHFPDLVRGEKDAMRSPNEIETQGLNYNGLTSVLVKALQEQQAIIADLKARVAALEA